MIINNNKNQFKIQYFKNNNNYKSNYKNNHALKNIEKIIKTIKK